MRCLLAVSCLAAATLAPGAFAQTTQLFGGGGTTIRNDFTEFTRTFPQNYRFAFVNDFVPAEGDADFFVAELRYTWKFDGFFIDSQVAPIVSVSSFEPPFRLEYFADGATFQPELIPGPIAPVSVTSVQNPEEPNISRLTDRIVDNNRVYRYIVPAEYAQNSQRIEFRINSEMNFQVDVLNTDLEADLANFTIFTFEPELTWVPYEPEVCPADLTGDGSVDLADLNIVLANFGQPSSEGDADGNGSVDLIDLNIVLASFGSGCE